MELHNFDQKTKQAIVKYQHDYLLTHGKHCSTIEAINAIISQKGLNTDFTKVNESDIES